MSDILANDKFIAIPLNVGAAIGSYDEAIMLQLVHRWCLYAEKEGSEHNYQEGHYWTYMTYKELNEQLPMFKMTKVKKLIKDLREKELLIVGNFNRAGFDRTNWYRVNYEKLEVLMSEGNSHWSENDQSLVAERPMHKSENDQPIPKSSSKSSSKSIKRYSLCAKGGALKAYAEVYEQYQNKKHPTVTLDQLNELEKQLSATDVETYPEIFRDMAHIHFQNLPKGNDGHILAFVGKEGRSPLKRYYELALELPF